MKTKKKLTKETKYVGMG